MLECQTIERFLNKHYIDGTDLKASQVVHVMQKVTSETQKGQRTCVVWPLLLSGFVKF